MFAAGGGGCVRGGGGEGFPTGIAFAWPLVRRQVQSAVLAQGRRGLAKETRRDRAHGKGVGASHHICIQHGPGLFQGRAGGHHQWRLRNYILHGMEGNTEAWKNLGHGLS